MLRRTTACLSGAAIFLVVVALAGQNRSGPPSPRERGYGAASTIDITVSEGTSMALALSPDRQTMAIDLQGGLWTVPIKGGAAKRIIDEYYDARQPAWSPDGRSLAFQAYRDGTWRIWTVAPDGTGAAAITSGPFDDREPHWSPDGTRIAFSSDRSGNYDIWMLDVKSRQVTQVTKNLANDSRPHGRPTAKRSRSCRIARRRPASTRLLLAERSACSSTPRVPSARRRGRRTARTSSTA